MSIDTTAAGTVDEPAPAPLPPTPVRVEVQVTDAVLHAMAHNRISPVSGLTVEALTDAPIGQVTLTVEVVCGDTALSSPWVRYLDQFRDRTSFDDVQVDLDAAAMAGLDERRHGHVVVTATADGHAPVVVREHVHVLAHNQWVAWQGQLSHELLAAHVQPNHPAVATLLGEAADVLRRTTGVSALDGYQSGPDRVDAIAGAVWQALQARQIRYTEPPAGFDLAVGQKIRTPGQVLDDRFGTCLDLTVLFAAALEQAGIRPLIWLPEGHALVGYWRQEVGLPGGYAGSADTLANLGDLGLLQLVETTLVCERAEPVAFDAARARAHQQQVQHPDKPLLGIVDVAAVRAAIVPLPAHSVRADGTTEVHLYQAGTVVLPGAYARPAPAEAGPTRAREPERVRRWKNNLLDLSRRNKLVHFTTTVSGIGLAVPGGSLPALENLLNEGRSLSLFAADEIAAAYRAQGVAAAAGLPDEQLHAELVGHGRLFSTLDGADTERRSRTLIARSRTIQQETGANTLFVTLGLLRWTLNDGHEVRSPLVIVPVRLSGGTRGRRVSITLDEAGSTTPNYCLLERLRLEQGLEIPGLAEPAEDGAGIDLEATFQAVRVAAAEHGLPCQVEETAALAVLDYARYPLWRDLDEHWETFADNPLVARLVDPASAGTTTVPAAPRPAELDALAAVSPMPADSAQLEAVHAAVGGQTFVLEGPPGTGKSQTITNLLARCMAEGRTVLFVAEKAAALSVVKDRVDEIGLGPFCLDVHDKGSKPAEIRAQLRAALGHTAPHDTAGHAVAEQDLARHVRVLASYAQRLHETGPTGLSVHTARNEVLARGDGPTVDVPQRLVLEPGVPTVNGLRGRGGDLHELAQATHPTPEHPWGFVGPQPPAGLDDTTLTRLVRAVDDTLDDAVLADLPPALAAALLEARTLDDLQLLRALTTAGAPDGATLDAVRSDGWQRATTDALTGLDRLTGPGGAAEGLSAEAWTLPLPDLRGRVEDAARSNLFVRGGRLKRLVPEVAVGLSGHPPPHKALPAALERLQSGRAAAAAWRDHVHTLPGLDPPADLNPLHPDARAWLTGRRQHLGVLADAARRDGAFGDRLRELLAAPAADRHTRSGPAHDAVAAVLALWAALAVREEDWARWADGRPVRERWQASSARRHRDLDRSPTSAARRWAGFVAACEPFRMAGLDTAHGDLLAGRLPADLLDEALERGLARASLQERLTSQGFDEFDPDAHERIIAGFNVRSPQVRQFQRTALPTGLLQQRAFDPTSAAGRISELRRHLERERGRGLPIRRLMESYGDLLTQITPCVLVSPASLARFFPPGAVQFDVVVFDEASQIRVADAVGAMGRARSVVVVGDSKQMPPSSFGEVLLPGLDDEALASVETVEEDQESILQECVTAGVPQRWLTWHYRSTDESLIAFSNSNYYEGRLSSFPGPVSRRDGFGVHFRRVDGHFARPGDRRPGDGPLGTNRVEADAVVAEVERRFTESAGRGEGRPSIGVVTFNQPQQVLISDLLLRSQVPGVAEALESEGPYGLFVKNLENVQGDERDVILFSTGFAPNARGVLPLNFGPLNRGGGERRLNVAVTRARREVLVLCSFDPEQLRTEGTASIGVRRLKEYLELARDGVRASGSTIARTSVEVDRHRDSIATALRARGLHVATDVGLSRFRVDLAVRADPDGPPVLAVLLDGRTWAERRTVGDRDGLPGEVLRGLMGWPAVARVWLPSWLADPDPVVDRLAGLVADVEAGREVAEPEPELSDEAVEPGLGVPSESLPVRTAAQPAGSVAPSTGVVAQRTGRLGHASPDPTPPSTSARAAAGPGAVAPARVVGGVTVVDFAPWEPGVLGAQPDLSTGSARRRTRLRGHLLACVAAEGPVHAERLARLVATAHGLGRVQRSRQADLLQCLPPEAQPDADGFVWPPGNRPGDWLTLRESDDNKGRPLEHVPVQEVANALVVEAVTAGGAVEDQLLRGANRRFGGLRLTEAVAARLRAGLELAVAEGRLERRGEVWVARR